MLKMWTLYEGWRDDYIKRRKKELEKQARINAQYINISKLKPSIKQVLITSFIDKNGDAV